MPWINQPCVVIASGPSLAWDDYADVALIRQSGINTIAVNDSWKVAPFCDVIYAGDTAWWRYNHKTINIDAARWSCSRAAKQLYDCFYRERKIKPGYNSGANAVELAANYYDASPIIMIGFDCSTKHGIHHHGKHQKTSNPTADRADKWKPQFKSLRDKTKGTEIINCSRYSEIKYFPRRELQGVLCELGLISDTPKTNAPDCSKTG